MNLSRTKSTKATLLFTFFLCCCLVVSYTNQTTNWSAFYGSVLVVAGIILAATLLVVAVRATMVTWITVLVLLAFAGKRRRVLVQQGRKITTDVAMYSVKVVLRERGLVAVACATLLSFMAIVRIKESD